ncbi:P-loop containing nucleoside triphosphate hydrolase protein [Auriscalpium vulgare]|uniref:P-loop containing nucleoside triphosphate hydrolase protein n=1 Tax=Auriscalpium vulgare TaxID=40419 RepID=A0ACB8RW85_9AGAM|nr:P-loop containing nucleoside triphosphate hydrolase protein [Auriscalpium vulgare]
MPPKPSRTKIATRQSTLKLDAPPPSKKPRLAKPLSTPPVFDLTASQSPAPSRTQAHKAKTLTASSLGPRKDVKGKGKAKDPSPIEDAHDDRLWVDRFEPQSEEELAVHKRKVEDVRRWLQEAFGGGKIAKYRRLLVLTGPAGSAKTTTLRILSRTLNFNVVEWRNTAATEDTSDGTYEYESAMDKFEAFLARAGTYSSVFAASSAPPTVILLEDLPNILHPPTRERFHAAVRAHTGAPIVIVVSDAGVRGEGSMEDIGLAYGGSSGSGSWARRDQVVDARSVVPDGMLGGTVTEISFNPIAPTLMTPALTRLLAKAGAKMAPGVLQAIVDGASGDVRSAVMALEFAWVRGKGKKRLGEAAALEAITRRENGLVLFHLLGKVLYNKRKGDPPSASASAKDKAAERVLDARLKDQPPLPPWLSSESRKTSRVDADILYASTPIDASLFGLYIHENYTRFCNEVDECAGVMDALSFVDAGGGEKWYETNPYTFHLHALATMHALPAPVPRTGQRVTKPAFFEALRRERSAISAVEHVGEWLARDSSLTWTPTAIATELGAALRAGAAPSAPSEHRLFSELVFGRKDTVEGVGEAIGERDVCDDAPAEWEDGLGAGQREGGSGATHGGWLEDDDIEEW